MAEVGWVCIRHGGSEVDLFLTLLGFAGTLRQNEQEIPVFVKTFGTHYRDVEHYKRAGSKYKHYVTHLEHNEAKARREAEVYLHRWFAMVSVLKIRVHLSCT